MNDTLHFGLIGLTIGDFIDFKHDNVRAMVASGDGTPENGGSMVRVPDIDPVVAYSLKAMTRKLLDGKLDEATDIWDLWLYEGTSLREMSLQS